MKILAVGGGSGGHVTPVVAVLHDIKQKKPNAEIRFWCDHKFSKQAKNIISDYDKNIPVSVIVAGKFRRYHHLSVLRQLFWPSLMLKNTGDVFLVLFGFIQSFLKLIFWRPDVVFTKGGYVCLPVGLAAHFLRIPLVIHDSDAHPGLTNLILSKWANSIATGAPLEYYPYPEYKTKYVGVPVSGDFRQYSLSEQTEAKREWGIDDKRPLLVVTGGGLGASRINDTVAESLEKLIRICSVILVSGAGQYDELRSLVPPNDDKFQLHAFISKDMASLLAAADVVVTRAGATTILELAALAKPTILIPNAKLTGGHQVKNAAVYAQKGAAVIVDEDEMLENHDILINAVKDVISNQEKSQEMAKKFNEFACPDAASKVADMVLANAK